MSAPRNTGKWLRLSGLAVLGLCTVSIPLTIAVVMSATGASDVLTLGRLTPSHQHRTPATAVAALRCTATRGYYALTFDEGPYPRATPQLVAALRKSRAVATFFGVGARAAARQDLVELQRSVGQVANHSYSHPHMPLLSEARRVQELQTAARVLDYPNVFFRPPYGETSPAMDADVRRAGLTAVYWTVDTRDYELAAEAVVTRALTVRPGGIILMHQGVKSTLTALPAIVDGLKQRGMCPGFLATSGRTAVSPGGRAFHVIAVKP